MEVDAALYWLEKRNVLISRGMDEYTQAGKLRSQGLELALNYHAPRFLDLSAGYSLNDATYRRFVEPDPVTGEDQSLRGRQLEFAPRHTGSARLGTSAWFKRGRAHVILSVRNLFDARGYYSSAINQWAENPQVTPDPGREVLCTLRLSL